MEYWSTGIFPAHYSITPPSITPFLLFQYIRQLLFEF